MLDNAMRVTLEQDVLTYFSTIDLSIPPELTDTITLPCEVAYPIQDVFDKMLVDEGNNYIWILVSYPTNDSDFMRTVSDKVHKVFVPFLVSEQLPAAGDYVTVDGATTATFTFQTSEPYIDSIAIYTKPVAGSTSWLNFVMTDNLGVTVFKKTIFMTELLDDNWISIDIGKSVKINPVTGLSLPFTITISEDTFGALPSGQKIGKNGANVARRIYTSKLYDLEGKVGLSIMRFSVYAKDKKVGNLPSKALYMSKNDILIQTIKKLRSYIIGRWIEWGLNDVRPTVILDNESANSVPFASGLFDVLIESPDLGITDTPVLGLKTITIETKGV